MPRLSLFQTREEKIGTILCVVCAVIFGLYPPAAKIAYADGANITFIVLFTTIIRFVFLYGFSKWYGYSLFQTRRDMTLGFWGGFFQALSIIGILGATYFIPGSIVIIILFTYSLMLLFFSAWRGRYQLNAVNISMTLLALVGLSLVLNIFSMSSTGGLNPIGIGLSIMAAFATFARVYIFGIHGKDKSPAVIGAEAFMVAALCLLFMVFWEAPIMPQTVTGWGMSILSALSLALGSFGIFYGVAMLGAYRFGMIAKLEPIFTALFGFLLLGEVLDLNQYVGMMVVIGSLLSLQLLDKQKAKEK